MKNPFDLVRSTCQVIASVGMRPYSAQESDQQADLQTLEDRVLYNASPLGAVVADIGESIESLEAIDNQIEQLNSMTFEDVTPVMPDESEDHLLIGEEPPFIETARQLIVIDEPVAASTQTLVSTPTPTIVVTTLEDRVDATDGLTSLREALALAEEDSSDEVILLASGTHELTLNGPGGGELQINNNVTFVGQADGSSIIDGCQSELLEGESSCEANVFGSTGLIDSRVFNVVNNNATFINLTITGGDTSGSGGGLFVEGNGEARLYNVVVTDNAAEIQGGGIANQGSLIIENSTISSNEAGERGGGISSSNNTIALTNVTVSGNSAGVTTDTSTTDTSTTDTSQGGGIFVNNDTHNFTNVTVSGNRADEGGGIFVNQQTTANIVNSTITKNTANVGGGVVNEFFDRATINVTDSIIAQNMASTNIAGSVNQNGFNIIDNNANLFLGELADNGGAVETHALLSGSDGIDQGATVIPGMATDARGFVVNDSRRDIGAFEHNATSPQSQNNAPVVDLDSTTAGLDFSTTFQAGGPAVSIVNEASISDIDSTIQTLTVQISNIQDGADEFLAVTSNPNIGSSYTASTGLLTLFGGANATNADFMAVVNSLTYENVSTTPDTTTRTITFVANDGAMDSIVATTFLSLTADITAPTAINNLGSTVNEGGFDFIEIGELSFSDDLQPTSDITFNVTSATNNGFLALASDPTTQIGSFTQADIDNNNLIYVHAGDETLSDSFTFTVDDGQGNTQAGQIFNITVNPVNDAPETGGFVETRLADLTRLSGSGFATFRENAGHRDAQIDINGQTFFHGIGVHPSGNPIRVAVVEYDLDGATRFTAVAGLNDTILPSGSGQVIFRAYVDDVLVFDSGRVDTNSAAVDVDFNTTGGSVLRLEVDPDGSVASDHAVWANATLVGTVNQSTTISIAETAPNGTFVGTYNGSDVNLGDTLTYSLLDSANGGFAIDSNTGVITVDDADQLDFETASSHMITVRIDDGTTFTDDIVTIELSDINESPMGMDVAIIINEDATHTFAAADFDFVDVEGDTLLQIRIRSLPTSGTLALNGTPVTSNQTIVVADLPNLVYTPAADGNGQNFDSFDFSVRDSRQLFSDSSNTLTFHVAPVNDAPVVDLDSTTAGLDFTTTYRAGGNPVSIVNGASITDIDSTIQVLTVTIVGQQDPGEFVFESAPLPPNISGPNISGGTFTFSNAGTATNADFQTLLDSLEYLSFNTAATGVRMLEVVANDGAQDSLIATTTVNIVANNAPGSFDSTVNGDEDDASITVTISGTDSDGTISGYNILSLPTNGTLYLDAALTNPVTTGVLNTTLGFVPLRFVPDADFNGIVDFEFAAIDNDGAQDATPGTTTIGVAAVNDAPTDISPDSTTLSENIDTTGGIVALTLDTADVDVGDSFTYSIVGGANAGNFSIVGNQLIFDAGALNFEVQDSYEVSVRTTDSGGLSHVETLTVFVSDQNDAPVVVLNQGAVVDEGSTITIDNALLQTTDEDQNSASPTYLIASAPSEGTLLINGIPATTGTTFTQADIDAGLVSYAHSGSEASLVGFTFDILENSNVVVAGQTFSIVVFPVNNNPIADNDSFQVDEDTSLTGNVITNSDTDVDNDMLTATLVNGPINADTFLLNPDGSFTYTPVENFHGTDTFEYQIADGNGGFDTATVVITVQSINDSPVANSDSYEIISGQDSSVAGDVLLNDIDVDGDALTAILVDRPANGTLAFDADGSFVYTPNPGFFGVDTFTYLASDGVGTSATSVEVNVMLDGLNVQNPPTISEPEAVEPTRTFEEPPLEEAGDNLNQSEEEEESSDSVVINAIPPNPLGHVPVLDLTDQVEFQAEGDSQDLIKLMTNRRQARAVLGSLLANVSSIQANDGASTDVAGANELAEFKDSVSGLQTIFNAGFLFEEIASQIETDEFGDLKLTIGAVTGIGSLGYILWTLRGGALMAVALAQLPSWRMIDPLPILDSYVSGAAGGADPEFDDYFG